MSIFYLSRSLKSQSSVTMLFLISLLIVPFSWQNAFAQMIEVIEIQPDGEIPLGSGDAELVYDSSRGVVFYSGLFQDFFGSRGSKPEIWEWDGSQWTFITSENLWDQTELPGENMLSPAVDMVYDPKHNEIIRFGAGFFPVDNISNSWTYKWNIQNKEWEVISRDGPSENSGNQLVWDSKREVVVMHGGWLVEGITNDTWIWDGSTRTWTNVTERLNENQKTPEIWGFQMVYDESRDRTIVFSAMNADWELSNDVYEWDGTQWITITPSGQGPFDRNRLLVAYDPTSQKVIAYGGGPSDDPFTFYNDTWTWDGSSWTLIHPGNDSFPLLGATDLVSIPNKKQLFTFGGSTNDPIKPNEFDNSDKTWAFQLSPSSVFNWQMFQ